SSPARALRARKCVTMRRGRGEKMCPNIGKIDPIANVPARRETVETIGILGHGINISYIFGDLHLRKPLVSMILSMTGYGRGEVTEKRITALADLRSVNNRFLEVSARLPRTLSMRENDVKELVRTKFTRGKVNLVVTLTRENGSESALKINGPAAKS